ncbi:heterokaryon incompatibility, partial [Lentithecium fluviatile CBS 122367]
YVVLSYVWGPPSTQQHATPQSRYPLTIEDSIRVSAMLRLHYLWVDRYCIEQEGSPEKLAQIEQMNKIYNEATLIIIAAAGSDPHYGLPRISHRCRESQSKLALGVLVFVQGISPHPAELQTAQWTTRAWTYQEDFLSRRRLVFTDC